MLRKRRNSDIYTWLGYKMGIKTRFHQNGSSEYTIRVITYRKKRRYYYNYILKKVGKGIIDVICKFNGYYLLSFHADITDTYNPLVEDDNNDVDDNLIWIIDSEQHYYEFAIDVMNKHILQLLIVDHHFINWR